METGLKGKAVLITGSSRNMGRAAALAFAGEGANLALCTSSGGDDLDKVAVEARALGAAVVSGKCDVSDDVAVKSFVEKAQSELGSIDVAINVAGYRCEASFLDETIEAWKRNIEVNLDGPFHVCRAVLPMMIQRRWGRIINISGVSPFIGGPAAKAMVKLGIVGFTRGLASEFAKHKITANSIGPGYIARDTDVPLAEKPLPASMPMGRKGTYKELISLMLYLASEDAGFVTGQCYLANGGSYYL